MSTVFEVALGHAADETSAIEYLAAPAKRLGITLVLAHGAGAPQQSPFMVAFAAALAERGVDVITFNFPYTEHKRRVPDRADVLERCYAAIIRAVHERSGLTGNRIAIGGKSMGGRIATHVAAGGVGSAEALGEVPALSGIVLLGYPLHPPGRPGQLRVAHLARVTAPMLFVQGDRDTFGTPEELRPILATLSVPTELHVIAGGDHSFKVKAGRHPSQPEVYAGIQDRVALWLRAQSQPG